jgi:hypothetical protein
VLWLAISSLLHSSCDKVEGKEMFDCRFFIKYIGELRKLIPFQISEPSSLMLLGHFLFFEVLKLYNCHAVACSVLCTGDLKIRIYCSILYNYDALKDVVFLYLHILCVCVCIRKLKLVLISSI